MSACFQRMDGKPIEADVVYRYRLIDSIADGNAKNLRVQRFAPHPEQTTYEMVWPDGLREEIVGREAILEMIKDERKLARITAKSNEPIRQVMRAVKEALDLQANLLHPVKPRVLFSALGERHAEQIAEIAEEHGIPCAHLHHSMTESHIKSVRARFEKESGDLQGIVQLRMLGQGYDFPPISVVVPMRPYASFGEFYQFVGRGHSGHHSSRPDGPSRARGAIPRRDLPRRTRARRAHQHHLPRKRHGPDRRTRSARDVAAGRERRAAAGHDRDRHGREARGLRALREGCHRERVVHDQERVDQRREERALEALAQRYAKYAATSENPLTFEQYVDVFKSLSDSP